MFFQLLKARKGSNRIEVIVKNRNLHLDLAVQPIFGLRIFSKI
jgi:hypothetical protein